MLLISEDKALKSHIQGLHVVDEKNGNRQVGVWFGQPDLEIRAQSYPYMTLDLIDISDAVERQHRGWVNLPYAPEGSDVTKTYSGEFPLPVNLDYLITTYARQPRHDRQIISQLLNGPLRMRFGLLQVEDDNSVRRLDFLGFSKRDTVEDGKRLFVNNFTVRVSAEIIPDQLYELTRVRNINLDIGFTTLSLTQPTDQ
jgi:hypothetical protein